MLVLDTASQYAAVSPDGQLAALFDLRDVTMRNLQLAAVGAAPQQCCWPHAALSPCALPRRRPWASLAATRFA